ncbi:MAG: GNAT family N-acetyltransferase [Candidatus Thorarchaeota archaeon]|nr:MAG: GNAT family N-acetyltransferase [Candidatus Thorarchaeota archaeon]
MVKIRPGIMRDCKDLLMVYMGTHWADGYTTVEQIKTVHRGIIFNKWGWLVAEEKGTVVGEVIFRIEKNPALGRIGIIRDIGVDVRFQKRKIGTKLTRAAEDVLREKGANRVLATTPPEARNYWIKVGYFAKGMSHRIEISPAKVPARKTKAVITSQPKETKKLPTSMSFSHIGYPGLLAEIASEIVDYGKKGRLFEYYVGKSLAGVGAIVLQDDKSALFSADVTKRGLEHLDVALLRTAKGASNLRAKKVCSVIPKEHFALVQNLAPWRSTLERDIPVTRLI